MNNITIHSSNGILTVNPKNGEVTACKLEKGGDPSISEIVVFNLAEWKDHYNQEVIPSELDILDLGYWYGKKTNGYSFLRSVNVISKRGLKYEPPAEDWREMMINEGYAPFVF